MSSNIDVVRFIEAADRAELQVQELKGWFKVQAVPGGPAVYAVRRKRFLGRVDFSGFCLDHPAAKPIPPDLAHDLRLGRVRGTLRLDAPEDEIIDLLDRHFAAMKLMAEEEERARREHRPRPSVERLVELVEKRVERSSPTDDQSRPVKHERKTRDDRSAHR